MTGNRGGSLDRAASHVGLVVMESPKGFEADRFLSELVERLDDPVEIVDPDDIEGNLEPRVAILRSPLHAGLRGWRDTVVQRFDAGHSTILVLPVGVSGDVLIDEPVPTVLIDGGALRMTVPDVIEMGRHRCGDKVVDAGVAELLVQLSDGWPAWLFACCELIIDEEIGVDQLVAQVGMRPFRRRIVKRLMTPFGPDDRYRMAQLAHFDRFSDAAAVAIGGVEFAETVLPHAPGIYRTRSGQLRFVDPVHHELVAEIALDPAAAEALAPVLIADGELLAACRALLDGGLDEQTCRLLEALPGRVVDMSDQRDLLGVFRVLAGHIPDHPGLALKQARIHANLAEIAASVEACELALESSMAHDPVRLEASVELLLYRHRTISQEEAADKLAELRAVVGHSGPLPTRLREVEAEILGQARDNHIVQEAADRFVEVASEWEFQQENLRAAKALRGLAAGPLWHLGHYREAQTRLDKAAKLAIAQTFDYGVTLVFKAMFDARCCDWESHRRSLQQASFVVAGSGIRWLGAYLHLSSAYEAASRHSISELRSEVRTTRDLLGPLWATDTGVLVGSELAVLLAEVGAIDEAISLLESLKAMEDSNPVELGLADIIVHARSGDRSAARERWRDLDQLDIVPNDRRWRIELELARADALAGLEVDVTQAEKDAKRLDLTELLPVLAPELFGEGVAPAPVRVELFGGLVVAGARGPIDLPEGHVRDLVKWLAVNGGVASVESIVELLWPGTERKLGTRRLKNVMVKARQYLGADVVIREPTTVSFGAHVVTDVMEFESRIAEVDAKRRTRATEARSAAIAALEIYKGPLLPDDGFNDDINHRRFELKRKADALLGFLETEHRPNAAWVSAALQRVNAG